MRHNPIPILRLILLLTVLLDLTPAPTTAASDLLPDLMMAPLRDVRFQRTTDGRVLLRFSAEIVNLGAGPLEIHGERVAVTDALITNVRQRIFSSGGRMRELLTPATMSFASDGHNHWHVTNLERYELRPIGSNAHVGLGVKSGFCFFDNDHFSPAFPGAPAQPKYPGCGSQQSLDVTMGLSVGWGDVYQWNLPDQYIDVTALAPGEYQLTAIADADNWFAEQDDTNNRNTITLTIPTAPSTTQWQVFLCFMVFDTADGKP